MSTHLITFAIRGMFCAKCARDIERALAPVDGVVSARVNYATERAQVIYDPARVTAFTIVNTIRSLTFDTPLEQVTLNSDNLLYASSAQTVERMLGKLQGIVQVSANLAARTIQVQRFPEQSGHSTPVDFFERFGFRTLPAGSERGQALFIMRTIVLVLIALFILGSAGAHAGLFSSPDGWHSPLIVVVLSLIAFLGVGLPFYQFSFDAALQGEFDASVIIALTASAFAAGSLPLGLLSPSPWFTDLGFVLATGMTAAWFITRLYVIAREPIHGARVEDAQRFFLPIATGGCAVLIMVGVYLGILTALQSLGHALEQLTTDAVLVSLVALGFGTQIGLYMYLRGLAQATTLLNRTQATGATAVTGVGTGTSTLAMLACCAHHLADIAPLVALMGTGSLSGAAGFFTEWKYAFMSLGLVMNAIGIVVTVRTLRICQSHFNSMIESTARAPAAPTCH